MNLEKTLVIHNIYKSLKSNHLKKKWYRWSVVIILIKSFNKISIPKKKIPRRTSKLNK